ncbi:MAG: DUF4330 family protein [Eubacteriales bacterium]|nr:DUF4330 family protein [Clostridia bacterium]MDY2845177.1 DUF4330 family protein [Eubacteriales bacterium]
MENKKKLGALDVFIIAILIMCIVSIGLRVFSNKTSDISESTQLENYTVSFKVMGIRDSSARNYITKGTKFYLNDSNVYIGAINNGDITITDAQKYYDALDGSTVSATNTGTGDLYKVDVEAAFDVEGKTDSSGRFLLGGNQYIGENQELQIHSKYLSITILVTEITKSR